MKHCGELCRGCKNRCFEAPTKSTPLELQCWNCEGLGCEHCNEGYQPVTECPMKHIGNRLIDEINLVVHAMKNTLPEAGGLLDQDAKFVHTWQVFEADKNIIETDQAKRK